MVDAPALAASTLAALEHAELFKARDILKERLLQHSLCDEEGELHPMVELVLFEIRDIARKLHATKEQKTDMVRQALYEAGF